MPKIYLDHSDGRYSTRQLTDEEAAQHEALGLDVAHVADDVWAAYCRDRERDGIWQALWRSISNEQWLRRRERELLPLEDAEREIRWLRDDLARSRHMEKYHALECGRLLRERHRSAHAALTCVFPLPGCDVAVLPIEWREFAQDILDEYSEPRAEYDSHDRCCCGDAHQKLDAATIQQLRRGGFVVEHAAEDA